MRRQRTGQPAPLALHGVGCCAGCVGALTPGVSDDTLGPAEVTTGSEPTAADPINAMWLAVQNLTGSCLSADMGTFAQDLGSWQTFYLDYAGASSAKQALLYAQLDFWRSLVGTYGDKIRSACPTLDFPASYPPAGIGVRTSQELANLSQWAASVASEIKSEAGSTLTVVAVAAGVAAVGLGLWYVWPWLRR